MKRSNRGTVIIEVLIVTGVIGFAAKLAGWKPLAIFAKQPPTAQLTQMQADLANAQAELAKARAAADAAATAERSKQAEQVRWAQQMTEGAAASLRRVPAEHRTAETQLAADLVTRANFGLAAAIGALPVEKQAEILAIVDKALSGVQAERDEARALLLAKDGELRNVIAEREAIKTQLPVLEAKAKTLETKVAESQAEVTAKTNEVKVWSALKAASDREAGSLSGALERIGFWAAFIVGGYLFLAYVVPGLLKHLDDGPLKRGLRNVAGYATSGLLFHDAKKKLEALKT